MSGQANSGALKGNIELSPKIVGWLKRLRESNETGCLRASAGRATRELYFRDGSIVGIRTTVDDERLGELLIRVGRITRQHFEDASIFVRHGWRLGEILVELRILERPEIETFTRRQAIEVACAAIEGAPAEIRFEKTDELFVTLEAPLSVVEVVMEAARRVGSSERLVQAMRADGRRFHAPSGLSVSPGLPLTPEDAYLLSRFQEGATMTSVMDASQLDERRSAAILLGLVYSGLLVAVVEGSSRSGAPAARAPFALEIERMFRRLEREDPWQAIGLARDADTRSARDTFRKAVQRYHPDRHQSLTDPDLKNKLGTICQRFTDALTCLTMALRMQESDAKGPVIPLDSTWAPSLSKSAARVPAS